MKHITQLPDELPYRLVNFGVDTLVLNVRYADNTGQPAPGVVLPDALIEKLNTWQAMAKEREEPVVTPLVFQDAALQIYPHGAGKGQWRWLLTCPAFNLLVSRGRLNGVIAQVRFSAPFLWSYEQTNLQQDIWTAVVAVHDFLFDFFGSASGLLHLQVSQVHLCADIAGWDVSVCDWEHTFLSRARTRVDRAEVPAEVAGGAPVAVYAGRRLATLEFGSHGSALSCSIYNKSLEIKKSGKLWFQDIWKRHGWDGESEVWRVEFRWKREALHEIKQKDVFHGIETIEELGRTGRLSYLWTYCAGHTQGGQDGWPDGWLRYVQPSESESNLSRWSVHPAWSCLQTAFAVETEEAVNVNTGEVVELPASSLAVLIRKRHYEVNVKRLSQQMGGCAFTLAAWLGESVGDLSEVFGWLDNHLPKYALPDLAKVAPLEVLKTEYAWVFADTVAERRAIYGLRSAE